MIGKLYSTTKTKLQKSTLMKEKERARKITLRANFAYDLFAKGKFIEKSQSNKKSVRLKFICRKFVEHITK